MPKIFKVFDRYFFLILLIPLIFIAYPLSRPGMILNEDFLSEGIDNFWIWLDKGSYAVFDVIQRLPTIAIWNLLVFLNTNYESIGKLMVFSGFLLTSYSFYFSFKTLFKNRIPISNLRLKIAATVGSFFFAYNIWSFIRINHWYLWISYAVLPLFVVSTVYCFSQPRKWRYIILTAMLWSFASSTPFMVIIYSVIFIAIVLIFILKKSMIRRQLSQLKIPIISVIFLYISINIYWIYPIFLSLDSYEIGPYYVLTSEIGGVLSKDNDFLKILTLTGDWSGLKGVDPPSVSPVYPLWIVTILAIPILAFSTLLFKGYLRYVLPFIIVVIVGIVLAMGTQSPTNYYNLIFSIPLGWLFRDPNKWSLLIAFGYSFLIGIFTLKILNSDFGKLKNHRNLISGSLVAILLFSIGFSSYPIYFNTLASETGRMSPIVIPPEFDELNAYLSEVQADRVFFLPYPYSTVWSNGHVAGSFYQMSSVSPSIDLGNPTLTDPSRRNYYNYFVTNVIENRSTNIDNFIYPLGTEYMIFHHDSLDSDTDSNLLNRMYNLDGVENTANMGIFRIFRLVNNSIDVPNQFNVLKQNIGIVHGLDKLGSLNSIPSFSTLDTSVIFFDQSTAPGKKQVVNDGSSLILQKTSDDLVFSFIGDEYVVEPYLATTHHDPSRLWSRAGTMDPLHGEFHPYLGSVLGIENWDFDFGKGIVMTKATGTKLSIPFEIGKGTADANQYDIFVRYLNNQRGGELRVYLDDRVIGSINTKTQNSSDFVWENVISNIDLTEGEHTLTLENVLGFNAVNIFAVLPTDETSRLVEEAHTIANNTKNIYLLDAKSDFYTLGDQNNTFVYSLFGTENKQDYLHVSSNDTNSDNNNNNSNNNSNNNNEGNITKSITGSLSVPSGADHMYITISTNSSKLSPSAWYTVKNLEITPFNKNEQVLEIAGEDWSINDNKTFSANSIPSAGSAGDESLMVYLRQKAAEKWSSVSTDQIRLVPDAYYNYSMAISAKNVNQLHFKAHYYDSEFRNKEEILIPGMDGTFDKNFSGVIIPPVGSQYARFEILSYPNPDANSYYVVDNLKLTETKHSYSFRNSFDHLQINGEDDEINQPLKREPESSRMVRSEPFPVLGNSIYNYSVIIESNDINSINILASTIDLDDNFSGNSTQSNLTSPNPDDSVILTQEHSNQTNQRGLAIAKAQALYDQMEATSKARLRSSTAQGDSNQNAQGGFNFGSFVESFMTEPESSSSEISNLVNFSPGSEIYTDLDIIKDSNYTLALRADNCGSCATLKVSIQDENGNLIINNSNTTQRDSLQNGQFHVGRSNNSVLRWFYLDDIVLQPGHYVIGIRSDSETALDSVVLYSSDHVSNGDQYESVSDILSPSSVPAFISGYKKIDPTRYVVNITNATRPYVLSFTESFDPFWRAYVQSNETDIEGIVDNTNSYNPIPLYSLINGFYIDKMGDYNIVVEYRPQQWIIEGGMIGAIMVMIFVAAYYITGKYSSRIRSKFKSKLTGQVTEKIK